MSAIIVSWNVRELLVRCLQSLLSPEVSGRLNLEIIVVDNASHDGSAEVARSFAGVCVIENTHNLGYGRANNKGMAVARGRYLLILNPDTELLPGSLRTLLDFADSSARTGIVAPRLLNPDLTTQTSAFRFPTLTMAVLDLFPLPAPVPGKIRAKLYNSAINGRYVVEQLANQPFFIDHPLGACMLIRREAYEECGGFDPRIFMYSEEIDLAMRFAKAGWECRQVPAALVVHQGGASTKQLPARMMTALWRSRLYVYRKHRSRPALLALSFLLLLAQLVRSAAVLTSLLMGKISLNEARQRLKLARTLSRLAVSRR